MGRRKSTSPIRGSGKKKDIQEPHSPVDLSSSSLPAEPRNEATSVSKQDAAIDDVAVAGPTRAGELLKPLEMVEEVASKDDVESPTEPKAESGGSNMNDPQYAQEQSDMSHITGSGVTPLSLAPEMIPLRNENLSKDSAELKEQHRLMFIELNFPNGSIHDLQDKSKHHTTGRIQQYIRILQQYAKSKSYADCKAALPPDDAKVLWIVSAKYCMGEECDASGSKSIVLLRKHKHGTLRVVSNEEMFDYIRDAHIAVAHAKYRTTYNEIKSRKIFTISEKDVENYIRTCPSCLDEQDKRQFHAKNHPVTSFRDRFHLSFIDFKDTPGVGSDGVVYKLLMSLQDHCTRLTYLRALSSGKEGEIVEELSQIVGLLGYPMVCKIDGEKSDIILEGIKQRHPECWTVASGRKNEMSTKATKDLLDRMVKDHKEKYPKSEFTWLQFVGLCMACLNSTKSYGRNKASPYGLVFGKEYRFPASVESEQLRFAVNPKQLSLVVGDAWVKERLMRLGEIGETKPNPDPVKDKIGNCDVVVNEAMHHFQGLMDNGTVEEMTTRYGPADILLYNKKGIPPETVGSEVEEGSGSSSDEEDVSWNSDNDVSYDDADPLISTREFNRIKMMRNTKRLGKEEPRLTDLDNRLFDAIKAVSKARRTLAKIAKEHCKEREITKKKQRENAAQTNVEESEDVNTAELKRRITTKTEITTTSSESFVKKQKLNEEEKGESLTEINVHVKPDLFDDKKKEKDEKLRKGLCEVLPTSALRHASVEVLCDGLKYKHLQVFLDCMICRRSRLNAIPFISMYEKAYYDLMQETPVDRPRRWFESSLINAFITLKMHKHHRADVLYDICPYPTEEPHSIRVLPALVKKVIVVMWWGLHYGFMEINVESRYVLIKDGKLDKKTYHRWKPHVIFMLKKWGLITDAKSEMKWTQKIVSDGNALLKNTCMNTFHVIPYKGVEQLDSTECGPIACYHAWETIDPESLPSAELSMFRYHVIEELSSMWKEFNPCLRVRLPISLVTDRSLILREFGKKKDILTMTVDESDDDDGECPICFAEILEDDIFQASPCNHDYHVNCIFERQQRCLETMDGIVSCVKCNTEINNLVKYKSNSEMEARVLLTF